MTKTSKQYKPDLKTRNKNTGYNFFDEENISLRDVKRDKEHKQYRNYDNALRSKDLSRLLSYEDD
jgi:hypothetical protein